MDRGSLLSSATVVFAVLLLLLTDAQSAADVAALTNAEPTDAPSSGYVRSTVGDTAFLKCHLPDTGFHEVYWVRQQTGNVIMRNQRRKSGEDGRFRGRCSISSDDYALMIIDVQRDDSGVYHCVLDSNPPIRGSTYLSVGELVATILGEPIRTHWQDSAISLTCVIWPRTGTDDTVLWIHNDKVIKPFHDARVTITTDSDNSTTSHLLIQDAQPMDSGTYTCKPVGGSSDSIHLVVVEVAPDDFHPIASGSQRPRAVVPAASLLVLAFVATALNNHRCSALNNHRC